MMDTATAIKESVSCQQFADFIGLKVNRSGFAVCPFHGDNDASLKIYKGGRGWCCFGCHRGGDVINFASLWYGTNFKDTIKQLNDDFNLGLLSEQQETGVNRALMAVEVAKRKMQRLKEERQQAASEAVFWNVFDKWLAYDKILKDKAPLTKEEDFSPEFVEALIHKDEVYNDLIDKEMERTNYVYTAK